MGIQILNMNFFILKKKVIELIGSDLIDFHMMDFLIKDVSTLYSDNDSGK